MDPWLEAADIWPDFHDRFASEISIILNQTLPAPYYARLEMRPEIGVIDDEEGTAYRHRLVPDVTVVQPAAAGHAAGGTVALAAPREEISQYVEIVAPDDEGRHASIEIRDPRRGHRLVTLIEVLSPANKTTGVDRQSYLRKYEEIYGSEASLIEIDLLRAGNRILHNFHVQHDLAKLTPPPDYIVLVNRGWARGSSGGRWQLFPVMLRQPLPVIPVPLREGDTEARLDLQFALNRAYDGGPYRRGAVDYSRPPHPPLKNEDLSWAREQFSRATNVPQAR